jgi:hypothetical protein
LPSQGSESRSPRVAFPQQRPVAGSFPPAIRRVQRRLPKSGAISFPGAYRSHLASFSASRNITEQPAHSKNAVK